MGVFAWIRHYIYPKYTQLSAHPTKYIVSCNKSAFCNLHCFAFDYINTYQFKFVEDSQIYVVLSINGHSVVLLNMKHCSVVM